MTAFLATMAADVRTVIVFITVIVVCIDVTAITVGVGVVLLCRHYRRHPELATRAESLLVFRCMGSRPIKSLAAVLKAPANGTVPSPTSTPTGAEGRPR